MKRVSYRGIAFYLPESGDKSNSRDVGMQYWFVDSLRSTLTYIDHVWYCHSQVDLEGIRLLEVFAGIGVSSAYLRHKITNHVAIDHDAMGLEAFSVSHPKSKTILGDTYIEALKELLTAPYGHYDYILYEHNALTVYRALREPKERALLDAVFKSGAEYILFVDTAKVKEHLHRKLYGNFLGYDIRNSEDYIHGVSEYFYNLYGYSVAVCAHDSLNYSLLFKKDQEPLKVNLVDVRGVTDMLKFKELDNATI